ncbi:MAG TPA: hypothetical protein VEG64_07880 [Candidatus Sulfotelmatobacter sp.]|nr:hypothetical protein [Candidatus Sulfotelmatobacter sp.]
MNFDYFVFGLSLRSNQAIPGLKPAAMPAHSPDVRVELGIAPSNYPELSSGRGELAFVSSMVDSSGEPELRIWRAIEGDCHYLAYRDGMQFWVENGGRNVWSRWPDSSSLEDAATYLLGPVLGLVLRLRGVACLHASAVAIGGRAVAFVGEEGAGKSTTAAAFARRGHCVLTDDVAAIVERDGGFYVLPAYPYLSLWPESVTMLYGPEKTLPSFSANWDKRVLSPAEDCVRFQEEPLPLGAIFLLGERSSESSAPYLETLTPQESLVQLVANSYATGMLDKEMRAQEFALLGRMLANVHVCRVRSHEDPSRIERLCDVITDAVSSKRGAAAVGGLGGPRTLAKES